MNSEETKDELIKQTKLWLEKLEKVKVKGITEKSKYFETKSKDASAVKYLTENISAYTKDARYFMAKEDYVRSFEAVVWAWSFVTIGKELGVLE